ncbi:MAG: hypothetical protein BGO37_12380 [Cellulomonas sp. 73-92]|uniref:SseB family protein n=1 Tax=Cellulomonas sp. 73-92 TaxID=1895740 RepID=UPI00092B5246|nr:SseB family protein [Cellulomonas sp. 73-92]OJV79733.1 MAG: hypothetical protein BGO37_12380 [Cellulomonas sp. 73-92]
MSAPRSLPSSSPFAYDDGSADPALAAVLADHAAGRAGVADVLTALTGTRLLVAILPHGREAAPTDEATRAAYDPAASQAAVIGIAAGDGRAAMPVFTSVAALAAWRADARPVPTPAAQAAAGALAEGWQLLVLDPAGPVTVRLGRPAVMALAHGEQWRPAVRDGVVDDEVATAVGSALAGIDALAGCGVAPGERGEVAVEIAVLPGLDRAGLDAVVARVNEALAADATVAERVDSLELRVRPAG